jgi:hypothetical protein
VDCCVLSLLLSLLSSSLLHYRRRGVIVVVAGLSLPSSWHYRGIIVVVSSWCHGDIAAVTSLCCRTLIPEIIAAQAPVAGASWSVGKLVNCYSLLADQLLLYKKAHLDRMANRNQQTELKNLCCSYALKGFVGILTL